MRMCVCVFYVSHNTVGSEGLYFAYFVEGPVWAREAEQGRSVVCFWMWVSPCLFTCVFLSWCLWRKKQSNSCFFFVCFFNAATGTRLGHHLNCLATVFDYTQWSCTSWIYLWPFLMHSETDFSSHLLIKVSRGRGT